MLMNKIGKTVLIRSTKQCARQWRNKFIQSKSGGMFHFYWKLTHSDDDLQNTHWDYVSKNQNIQEYKIFDPWVGRPMIQKCLWYKLTACDTLTGWHNNLKQDFIMETSCCAKKFCMLWPDRVEATLECIQTTASWIFLKHSVAVRAFITLANSKP